MRHYITRRILFFVPAVLLVVLFSFILLKVSPGDPVERLLNKEGIFSGEQSTFSYSSAEKEKIVHRLGLDLPVFYFSLSSLEEKNKLENKPTSSMASLIPCISFHPENQFHRWLFGSNGESNGLVHGDLGVSWVTGQKVSAIILPRIKWSFLLSLFSVLMAYLISIPSGIYAASNPGSRFDKISSVVFSILFSLPIFWFSSILMLLFCNHDVLNILPSSGVSPVNGFSEEMSVLDSIIQTIPYLVLPTICYTYGSFAILTGLIKKNVAEILKEDYIRTATAKGLPEKIILRRHAFRNALLPLITLFTHLFPLAVSGSVIIETIFSIPGMGLSIFQSLSSQDYPVIISVFMITGIVTMASFLLSDILYAYADPRISYVKK